MADRDLRLKYGEPKTLRFRHPHVPPWIAEMEDAMSRNLDAIWPPCPNAPTGEQLERLAPATGGQGLFTVVVPKEGKQRGFGS